MKKRSSPALLLVFALLIPVAGQNPTSTQVDRTKDDEDVVRITTNLIQVDAVVTDNGKPVTDLTINDFDIRENNEEQKITNFSYVPLAPLELTPSTPKSRLDKDVPPPPLLVRPEQVRRTIALVVDDLGLSFDSINFVRSALNKFVDDQMQPGDLVAIILTGGGMGVLQQFTSDKRQLLRTIDRIRWNHLGRGGISVFRPMEGGSLNQPRVESLGASEGRSELDEFRSEYFTVGTLGAISYVVRGLKDLPGRKSVVLISDGIKIFTETGPIYLGPGIISTRNSIGKSDRILGSLRRLIDLANRAAVVIYTMNARGVQLSGLSDGFADSQNGLDFLAQNTGGLAIRNSNDLSGGIKRILDDQLGYYLIGYQPSSETFDPKRARFNRLSIKVKRPGLKVRYRSGFFSVTDDDVRLAPPATRAEQLQRAIVTPFAFAGLSVRLTTFFANDAKSGSFMRSLLHVDADKLTFTEEKDGWHKLVFDIMAVTFGENGSVVDGVSRTETVRVRRDAHRLILENGFDYILFVPIKKPGAYHLRAALRDTVTQRIGTASQFVEVPDLTKDRLALSGIVVDGFDPNKVENSETGRNGTVTTLTYEPQSGAGVRNFRRGLILEFGYVIYNARSDKSNNRSQLQTQFRLFRDGTQMFAGNVETYDPGKQTDLKRLVAGGRIRLGTEISPGEYVLQIIVTDLLVKGKNRTVTKWIDFQVSDK